LTNSIIEPYLSFQEVNVLTLLLKHGDLPVYVAPCIPEKPIVVNCVTIKIICKVTEHDTGIQTSPDGYDLLQLFKEVFFYGNVDF